MCLNFHQQRGFGLPMALFVITVLSLIIFSMAAIHSNSQQSNSLQINAYRALFAAESGLEAGLNLLMPPDASPGRSCSTTPFYNHDFVNRGLNQCSVALTCTEAIINTETVYTLNSQATCGSDKDQASRILEVRVR